MPRWLAATRPGTRSTVLEVDPASSSSRVVTCAPTRSPVWSCGSATPAPLSGDLPAGSADLVVGDAFGARSVPWPLATAEFVDGMRRVLRPGGLYVLNVIDNDPRRLLAAEAATVADRFLHVALLVRPDQLAPGGGGNAVLVASDHPLDLDAMEVRAAARGEPGSVLGPDAVRLLSGDADVLTDDHAPVDQLLTPYRAA